MDGSRSSDDKAFQAAGPYRRTVLKMVSFITIQKSIFKFKIQILLTRGLGLGLELYG